MKLKEFWTTYLYLIFNADTFTYHAQNFFIIFLQKITEHSRKSTPKTPNKNAPYIYSEVTDHEIDYNGILIIDRTDSKFKET
jgi:hypothetical protein